MRLIAFAVQGVALMRMCICVRLINALTNMATTTHFSSISVECFMDFAAGKMIKLTKGI